MNRSGTLGVLGVRGAPVALAMCLAIGPLATPAEAQARQGFQGAQVPPARPGPPQGVTPAELQQLFDAMVLMRAQETLKLTDEQFPQFLTRLKNLQEVRRRADVERRGALQELQRLIQGVNPSAENQAEQFKERLQALSEIEARGVDEGRKARQSLDEVLDLRQRAMFRLFEERMEQQKMDLLMRARQPNRGRQPF